MKRLPPRSALPIKNRMSIVYVEKAQIDVVNGVTVAIDKHGVRTQIPLGSLACVMLEPGTRISHEAIKLAADVGTLVVWVGEAGVRLYSAGQPGGARADRLLYQARLALDPQLRLAVVRKMFEVRFGERPPVNRSVDQLRGMEGARVRTTYAELAAQYGIVWQGRQYDRNHWQSADVPNRCLSVATSCLYSLTEAAVLAAGYAPAIGFLHSGKPRSFVYDIADLFKFETVVPVAFEAAASADNSASDVRWNCRDRFRETRLLHRIIPMIEHVLSAGEIEKPREYDDVQQAAFDDDMPVSDPGFR